MAIIYSVPRLAPRYPHLHHKANSQLLEKPHTNTRIPNRRQQRHCPRTDSLRSHPLQRFPCRPWPLGLHNRHDQSRINRQPLRYLLKPQRPAPLQPKLKPAQRQWNQRRKVAPQSMQFLKRPQQVRAAVHGRQPGVNRERPRQRGDGAGQHGGAHLPLEQLNQHQHGRRDAAAHAGAEEDKRDEHAAHERISRGEGGVAQAHPEK